MFSGTLPFVSFSSAECEGVDGVSLSFALLDSHDRLSDIHVLRPLKASDMALDPGV